MKKILIIFLLVSFELLFGQITLDNGGISSNSILSTQSISVTIGGEFITNGTFPASSNERVDQFITRVFNTIRGTILTSLRDENAINNFLKENENFALRNIKLIHNDGKEEHIDLAKFRLSGNFQNNPYLKDGDLIIFPTFDIEKDFISVVGAVNKEILFQFVEGDDLQTALFFARGIDSSYLGIDSCLISRLENNGQNEFKNYVPINSNIQLRKGDRIKVLYDERNNYNFKVLVLGEVNQPGYIPISKNSTTLSEIIRRAGGFTTNASLRFSELYRNNNSYLTLKRMGVEELLDQNISLDEISRQLIELRGIESLKLSRTAIIDFADTLYFNLDNELRTQSGYSIIDFTKLVDSNSYESSYIVQDGDLIIIPRKSEEIYVWGGVKKVGYYPFRNDFTAMDYIEIAGGLAELAYGDDEIYLIKGDSQNWVNISENQDVLVEPGDYIYALKEKPKNFGFYLGRVGSIASILGGIATIILLLTQIGK